jgi:DNA-binding NarL/FixJ family response regulator
MPRPERGAGQGTFCAPRDGGSAGGFGPAPSLFGNLIMPARSKNRSQKHSSLKPSLPLDRSTWETIAGELSLSVQQTRIVELILCGKQDMEIAKELELSIHTVRTYVGRIFDHAEVTDRMTLVLKIFAMAQKLVTSK